jgi:hypothetical protein
MLSSGYRHKPATYQNFTNNLQETRKMEFQHKSFAACPQYADATRECICAQLASQLRPTATIRNNLTRIVALHRANIGIASFIAFIMLIVMMRACLKHQDYLWEIFKAVFEKVDEAWIS